jgi:hypothetical protein
METLSTTQPSKAHFRELRSTAQVYLPSAAVVLSTPDALCLPEGAVGPCSCAALRQGLPQRTAARSRFSVLRLPASPARIALIRVVKALDATGPLKNSPSAREGSGRRRSQPPR